MRTGIVCALAAVLATICAPQNSLWAPWILDAVVESVSGRRLRLAHAWTPLDANPTPPRKIRILDGAALCRGAPAELDLSAPLLIRNATSARDLLSAPALMRPPLADLTVDYFFDASVARHLVPDARGTLGAVVANISRGHQHKLASQRIVSRAGCCAKPGALEAFLEALVPACAADILGAVTPLGSRLGAAAHDLRLLTVPVFVSGANTRTDMHSEPIASIALQLGGSKSWTLVPASASSRMRPRPSPDGRAYFYSELADAEIVRVRERIAVTTVPGDALWVPPWTWHQVTYDADDADISVAASLFHFRPLAFFTHNPPFALAVFPNLLKEILGIKTQ